MVKSSGLIALGSTSLGCRGCAGCCEKSSYFFTSTFRADLLGEFLSTMRNTRIESLNSDEWTTFYTSMDRKFAFKFDLRS